MGLLDEFLKDHQDEKPPSQNLSPLSATGGLTKVTNTQLIEKVSKNQITNARIEDCGSENAGSGPQKNLGFSNNLKGRPKNVTFVACARESESSKLPPFSQEGDQSEPSPVSSVARASDKDDKPGCGSCPACGYWGGYSLLGPGRYCFFSAVFKGKTARPVPIAEAQKACQKEVGPNL